jgi:aerobic-type carbon monoxide dehydrogenase small subunit (CoxS/CutS family)
MQITLDVNGESRTAEVDEDTPLLWVLRETLGLTGTKFGCGIAACGACTVHINGAMRVLNPGIEHADQNHHEEGLARNNRIR